MKYRLTDEKKEWCGHILHQIEAVKDFEDVKAGDKGGWIENEENLSQEDDCWVSCNAWVSGNAEIKSGNDFICITGLGSLNRTTTAFKTKECGVSVVCGCFSGDLHEFAAAVKKTHGDGKYAREYMSFIETVKLHFEVKELKDKRKDTAGTSRS